MELMPKIKPNSIMGFDIESQDSNRHAGLNQFMGLDPNSKFYKKPKKLVFDINRTVVTGFSLYLDQDDTKYYFNLNQADIENRIPWEMVLPLFDHIKENCIWACHNFSYECTIMGKTYDYDLGKRYIDTMQMAVSAYNADEYHPERLFKNGLGEIKTLYPAIAQAFKGWENGQDMSTDQIELLGKVIAKDSVAAHSYNGLVRSIRYGYGLKEAVMSFFNYKMDSFEATLGGKPHMGCLTGEEVLNYGADDAYWCVQLFHALYQYMQSVSPKLFEVFIKQENPMPYLFSQRWQKGIRVNYPAILGRQKSEREAYTEILREFKVHIQNIGGFDEKPSAILMEKQARWYAGKTNDGYVKYRQRILDFAKSEDGSDFYVSQQSSGAISERWLTDVLTESPEEALAQLYASLHALGKVPTKSMLSTPLKTQSALVKLLKDRGNFAHYMMVRVLLHDLCEIPLVYIKGDISTDGEARGKMIDRVKALASDPAAWLKIWRKACPTKEYYTEHLEKLTTMAETKVIEYAKKADSILGVLQCLNKMTLIDTRMKLYINPYLLLTDPETGRMYPTINSLLNTRRMAAQNPNPMQLSKRGESIYVRGFFLPDEDDEVLVSVDWTAVELVLIGDFSKDPAFYEAYGQKPFRDLHGKAAASAIAMYHPDFGAEDFMAMKGQTIDELSVMFPQASLNPVTRAMFDDGAKAYKFWRNDAGKPSNFGYWYSGNLMTVQEKLGWTTEQMWEATSNYRETFAVAEAWRVNRQMECRASGSITLADGHRRVRFEATQTWASWMQAQFNLANNPAISNFGREVIKRVSNRAGNQTVNADIQGSCATLAKRSIISLSEIENNFGASFWMPIHDELVYSVKKKTVLQWISHMKEVMCTHPEIVKFLMLDGTASMGLTLEPFSEKAPYGQIELDEYYGPEDLLPEEFNGQSLGLEQQQLVLDYLN
jgi:hypothetical protein